MPNRPVRIVSPRPSESRMALSEALSGILNTRVTSTSSFLSPISNRDFLINWGCASDRLRITRNTINLPRSVNRAGNKFISFQHWRQASADFPIPDFTTSSITARHWVREGHTVYCRTALRGHSGTDIEIARTEDDLVEAPLYTKGIDKRHEFRFHVVGGQVIDGVRKAFRSDVPRDERNRDIMNHAAGTIFVRSGPALEAASNNTEMMSACVRACQVLGLDFGAVDVITDADGNFYILEVNTAPGLEGTTLTAYANAFANLYNNQPVQPWNYQEVLQSIQLNQAENTDMPNTPTANTIPNVTTGTLLTPNSGFSGTSLTVGNSYEVLEVNRGRLRVRNDQGRLQFYTNRGQFNLASDEAVTPQVTAPMAPAAPTPPRENLDTSVPTDSTQRVAALEDGTFTNPTGSVQFNGQSNYLTTGNRYDVAEIRVGSENGMAFIGVSVDGTIRRWRASAFSQGRLGALVTSTTQAAPVAAPTVTCSAGNLITSGCRVRVITRNGGHGLNVGAIKVVSSIDVSSGNLRVEGSTRPINARRVAVVTREEVEQEQALRQRVNQVVSVNIGGTNYNVRQVNVSTLQQLAASLAV